MMFGSRCLPPSAEDSDATCHKGFVVNSFKSEGGCSLRFKNIAPHPETSIGALLQLRTSSSSAGVPRSEPSRQGRCSGNLGLTQKDFQ